MAIKILIADPDDAWNKEVGDILLSKNYQVSIAKNGKDSQLQIYQDKPFAVVFDLDIKDHSGLELLRYLNLNAQSIKTILTVRSKKRFDELGLGRGDLRKLGVDDILIKPFPSEKILKSIEGSKQFSEWQNIKTNESVQEAQEVRAPDQDFTKIKIENFNFGRTTIFDYYIRIADNKYIKVLHKGDFFEQSRIDKYIEDHKVTHLYFKTDERTKYINFVNQILANLIDSKAVDTKTKVNLTSNATEKYIEEIYVSGIKPQLVEEGYKLCDSISKLVKKEKGLSHLMDTYADESPSNYSHLFLVSFIGSLICSNLEWTTERTTNLIAFGAMVHDIGFLKLPWELKDKKVSEMSEKELVKYKEHPKLGVQMLDSFALIKEPVKQIVYQHHECINGQGFPLGLVGGRIYPLAKIVSLANEFANILAEKKVSPNEGLKVLVSDRDRIAQFDPDCIRALFKAAMSK